MSNFDSTKFMLHVKFSVHIPFVSQVSHYTFAICSYRKKQAEPTEMMELDGYTVDYCQAISGGFILHWNQIQKIHF